VPLVKLDNTGRIRSANRRARALLMTEPAGEHLSDLVEGLGRPVSDWLREAWTGRNLGRAETVRAIRADERFLQISLEQIRDEEGPAVIAVLNDATAFKSLETQFVQSQKMQAIGQLAGGVAHDFNNLLTAISGHCDLLLLRHDRDDPDFGDLTQISQNANRAAALVGQLLAFSRKQTLRPEQLDLAGTMGDLTHLLGRLVGEKVQVDFETDPEVLPVRADKRQLEQVVMNLVVNARDAMQGAGRVRLVLGNAFLATPLKRDQAVVPVGEYVTIRVIDEGEGIAPEHLRKIFEPFFTTKRAGKGTGLGLSMAYGIVKQSGGFIFADSIMGSGTTFTLYLPVSRAEDVRPPAPVSDVDAAASVAAPDGPPADVAADAPPRSDLPDLDAPIDLDDAAAALLPAPTHPPAAMAAGNVLLVEDETAVRAFAARALKLRGYTVIEADSAEAALATLQDPELRIDVFVTDVVMPGMDGPTWVAEALRTRPGVKVVFVSGYAEDAVSEQQARIPNSVFLPKPFSLSELTQTVSRQLH
jgi:two-component system cell cycle sensor histidine kinase/response regulator CckA